MHVVTLVANARGSTERRIMHDYTPKQITHIGDSMMRERTFVLNIISASLGKSGSGKQPQPHTGNPVHDVNRKQNVKAHGGVNHFDAAKPGGLTPGSRVYDTRGMSQKQAHEQLCGIMGQRPKED